MIFEAWFVYKGETVQLQQKQEKWSKGVKQPTINYN